MPTKPGDNKLGKRDTRVLEAYREKIDPEGRGVKEVYGGYWGGRCCVCTSQVPCDPAGGGHSRTFCLKGMVDFWGRTSTVFVCGPCCERAQ